MNPEYSSVLVRYGEIAIKSDQTRRRMTKLLVSHIKSALREKSAPFEKIRVEYGRIFVDTTEAEVAAGVVARVFGVVSTSPVLLVPANMEKIVSSGVDLAKCDFGKGLTFAVGARRLGTHDFTSQNIREQLGAEILLRLDAYDLKVNLSSPQQEIYVEVRNEIAYIFTKKIKGVGGMPTGSQGHVVCTVSTGLDSPIASYKVMKRGCIPVLLHFDLTPYGDDACRDLAIRQAQRIANYIHNNEVRLYIVPHGGDMTHVQDECPPKMTCLFCKRNMLRMARLVAIKEDADAIVTGEIIGEQASQTSRNLRVISSVVCDYPILRPNAGDDKADIQRIAAEIGTYEFSEEGLSCCSLAPDYPSVHANLEKVEEAEKSLDLSILEEQVSKAEIIVLRTGKEGKQK